MASAYLAVRSAPGKIHGTVIGMTDDGSPQNLRHLAGLYLRAREKSPFLSHEQIVDQVIRQKPGWLFSDRNIDEARLSVHAILDPDTNRLDFMKAESPQS